ncbi:MAG: SgcJ/EcaC family oxidoreductase [Ignavibacteriales bacterium]|nr:SgcJ/EcaC family oxidoreductase [Candidatus Cloacimonadota bacterium]MCF8307368.1 SgcJ/EcaC family oxidoreductase [Ignavibacteriales bacterium]
MNKNMVLELFDEWNTALMSGDPEQVTDLYAAEAILLPTMSNLVRRNHDEIKDYFVHFCENSPKGTILVSNVRIYGQIAINSGIYEFTFQDGSAVKARFTYVYKKFDRRWLIIEHHSSQLPEIE